MKGNKNDIKNKLVDLFGFKVQLIKSPQGNPKLYFGFVPHGTFAELECSSEDEKNESVKAYKAFTDYYIEALNIQPIFKSRYTDVCQQDCRDFESLIRDTIIPTYEIDNNVKLLELFKACLGLIDYGILPRYLQNLLFNNVK